MMFEAQGARNVPFIHSDGSGAAAGSKAWSWSFKISLFSTNKQNHGKDCVQDLVRVIKAS